MQIRAYSLWVRDVNQRGGLLGRKVKLIVYDDGSDPDTARSLYEHLVNRDRVELVFSPYSGEITAAVLPVTERHGYPLIASGSSEFRSWQKGYKYLFGSYTPADRYTVGFLEMITQYGLETVAIVYAKGDFPVSVATGPGNGREIRVEDPPFFGPGVRPGLLSPWLKRSGRSAPRR
jgi:branched-chain amino acid transport system substrate-binding protein